MGKREKALAAIKVAGATNDQITFLRLYTENRIPIAVAKQAFADGLKIGARAGLWS